MLTSLWTLKILDYNIKFEEIQFYSQDSSTPEKISFNIVTEVQIVTFYISDWRSVQNGNVFTPFVPHTSNVLKGIPYLNVENTTETTFRDQRVVFIFYDNILLKFDNSSVK